MKKAIALFTVASLALLVAAPVAAFNFNIGNILDDSLAKIKVKWSVKLDVKNVNDTDIVNTVSSSAGSGLNHVLSDDDMAEVTVTTGATDSASLADSTANTNSIVEDLNGAEEGNATLDNVDDSSTVKVNLEDDSKDNVVNKNWVAINDDVDSDAGSGLNIVKSGDSLTGADVASGAAMSAAGAIKLINSNIFDKIRR